jgi:tripartite-type tricarboxylate transporter receptor subunit TctC
MNKIALVLAGLMFAASVVFAAAQTSYPTRPIRLINPYAPGGGSDAIARRFAQELSVRLGQPMVMENIGGAGGIIGMRRVAEAAPDGHTLAFGLTAQFAVNPSLFSNLPYDPLKDFEPVSLLASAAYVLLVHPAVPASSLPELIAVAKKEPGKLHYASAGNGSGAHLSTELLKSMTGIELIHVPYKGAGPAFPDLLSGRVPVMFSTYAPVAGHLQSGKLRALGVSTPKRILVLPNVPAIAEMVPGFESPVWYMVAAPSGTPRSIITKLNLEFLRALQLPAVRQQFEADGMVLIGTSPEEARDFLRGEIAKWAQVVKASGARVDQ